MKWIRLKIAFCLFLLLFISGKNFAQNNPNEWGGLSDIFEMPVGARAMALGGAYTAVTDEPFALYWNPGALENVTHPGIGLYYTNLPGGANYNYMALTYPSLFFGTFSIGYMGIGINEIPITADDATQFGPDDSGRSLFMVGYGYKFFDLVSLGTSFKMERAKFVGYPDEQTGDTGNIYESAYGVDLGILITPQFDNLYLSNLSIGISLQNALQRSIRAEEYREKSPRNLRAGIAKVIPLHSYQSSMLFAFDISRNDKTASVPTHYHFGIEYSYLGSFMVRAGYDRRGSNLGGNGPTYGIGVKQFGVSLDYSFWAGGYQDLTSSHRVSFVYEMGKSRQVRLDDYMAAETERIRREVLNVLRKERETEIYTNRSSAERFYENKDYYRAFRAVNKVLSYDEDGNNPDFDDMRELFDQIEAAIDEQRRQELEAEIVRSKQEADILQRQKEIEEHIEKARQYYLAEEFNQALQECDRALEINPESESAKQLRETVDRDLRQKIDALTKLAVQRKNEGRLTEAVNLLTQAREFASGKPEWESFIRKELRELGNQLSYRDLIRQATDHERSGNWTMAADLYQRALKSRPNDTNLQSRLEYTSARANATDQEMTAQVQDLYSKGTRAVADGRYDEALDFFEQARKLQPYNKTILKAIDFANGRKVRQTNSK